MSQGRGAARSREVAEEARNPRRAGRLTEMARWSTAFKPPRATRTAFKRAGAKAEGGRDAAERRRVAVRGRSADRGADEVGRPRGRAGFT